MTVSSPASSDPLLRRSISRRLLCLLLLAACSFTSAIQGNSQATKKNFWTELEQANLFPTAADGHLLPALSNAASQIANLSNITKITTPWRQSSIRGMFRVSTLSPVLLTQESSTRAIALESVTLKSEPFSVLSTLPLGQDQRARIVLFAVNADLLPGENASAVIADALDESIRLYPLTVEYVAPLEGFEWISCVVLRLNDQLAEVGDVLVRISLHGLISNSVRVGLGHIGGGPPDGTQAPPPQITVSPVTVSFTAVAGGASPAPQNIQVTTSSGASWTSFDSSLWFNAGPTSGPSGASTTLTPNTQGLAAGNYSQHITFSSAGLQNNVVAVNLTVTPSGNPTPTPTPTPNPTATPTPTPTPTPPPPGAGPVFFVDPNGSSSGSGSINSPWDLTKALNQPPAVVPGSTIYLRAGTYVGTFISRLSGSPGNPITIRNYNNERATIDGNMQIPSGKTDTIWWGLEFTQVNASQSLGGIDIRGARTKLVNNIVHDIGGNGIDFWAEAPDSELYGNLVYYFGEVGGGTGTAHGIYTQNDTGTKLLKDNIIYHGSGYGLHMYGEAARVRNYTLTQNVIVQGGNASAGGTMIVLAGTPPVENISIDRLMTYGGSAVTLGGGSPAPGDYGNISVTNSYVHLAGDAPINASFWSNATITGNTVIGTSVNLTLRGGVPGTYIWNNNTYWFNTIYCPGTCAFAAFLNGAAPVSLSFALWKTLTGFDSASSATVSSLGKPPSGKKIFVYPNNYEPGRGNIIIYNWDQSSTVDVDVSNVLNVGDNYEVRNTANYYGPPVKTGTYGGGTINLNMTGLTPATAQVRFGTPAATGPEFNAFILIRR